jgi:hypothetical protein
MDLDGALDDAKKNKDGSQDGADDGGVQSDSYIPPPPPDGGLWCGALGDSGSTYCQGTCCVKIGNGYTFACKPFGDPCAGFNFAFSCDRTSDCKGPDYCCFTETGNLEAGTYLAESHCGTCQQMDSMCLSGNDDCPDQTVCHPWFSTYGQCY